MSATTITNDVLGRLIDMGEGYIYNDNDFISQGEPQSNVSDTDLASQLANFVSKNGDSMIGNLSCPTVQVNSIQFSDNTTQSSAVSNTDLNNIKTATQQITYSSDASGSTNITNLTTGNFNTSFLSGMTENIQSSLDTIKTKVIGITYINSQTVINNLNATTFTAGNFNTSHLSGTISNIQEQINSLKTNVNGINISFLSNITSDVQTQFNTITSNLTTTNTNVDNINTSLTTTNTNVSTLTNTVNNLTTKTVGNQINYTNNEAFGSHNFLTNVNANNPTTLLSINPTSTISNVSMLLQGATSSARTIGSTIYSIYNKQNGTFSQIGSIESSDNNININYINSTSTGSHNFISNNVNSMSVNSNGISINGTGKYIQFPDNTKQYTSYATYSKTYTTNQTVTIPDNCYKIDLSIIGPGGQCGGGRIDNQGRTLFGGTGGGGQTARTSMFIQPGTQFNLIFVVGDAFTFGYVQVNWNKASNGILAKVLGGNLGGDASKTQVGAGAESGSLNPTVDGTYTQQWLTTKSTAGYDGTISVPPAIAGAPSWFDYVENGYGTGRPQFQKEAGLGVVMITYYLNV